MACIGAPGDPAAGRHRLYGPLDVVESHIPYGEICLSECPLSARHYSENTTINYINVLGI
jgi:hypothetical protein